MRHSEIDHCFGRTGVMLVVLGESPIAAEPAKGPFDHPALRVDDKADLVHRLLDDLERQTKFLRHPSDQVTGIAGIRPQETKARVPSTEEFQHQVRSIPVLDLRAMDHACEEIPERVNDDMTLAPVDFFSPRRSRARHQLQWS